MTSGHNSRTEDDSLGAEKPNIKRTSLVIWDESTETIANDENVTEVHIEIAQEEKHIPQRTVPFENVPIWMQDNALITDAYRPPLYSYKLCLRSLFFQHNESGKIHWIKFRRT